MTNQPIDVFAAPVVEKTEIVSDPDKLLLKLTAQMNEMFNADRHGEIEFLMSRGAFRDPNFGVGQRLDVIIRPNDTLGQPVHVGSYGVNCPFARILMTDRYEGRPLLQFRSTNMPYGASLGANDQVFEVNAVDNGTLARHVLEKLVRIFHFATREPQGFPQRFTPPYGRW